MVSFSASYFETLYGKIVTLARVAINRPIVNLGDRKTFSCNQALAPFDLHKALRLKV